MGCLKYCADNLRRGILPNPNLPSHPVTPCRTHLPEHRRSRPGSNVRSSSSLSRTRHHLRRVVLTRLWVGTVLSRDNRTRLHSPLVLCRGPPIRRPGKLGPTSRCSRALGIARWSRNYRPPVGRDNAVENLHKHHRAEYTAMSRHNSRRSPHPGRGCFRSRVSPGTHRSTRTPRHTRADGKVDPAPSRCVSHVCSRSHHRRRRRQNLPSIRRVG